MYPAIQTLCTELEQEFDEIAHARKEKLHTLATYLTESLKQHKVAKATIICTHNSRRSHIGQLWLAVAADYYGITSIESYSGGTEATAFNIRAVQAFQRAGFDISTDDPKASNPKYAVRWATDMKAYVAFSKKYDAEPNPHSGFAAIMVCTSADEACPIVPGSELRLALPYDDPKAFDDSPQETEKYDERLRQIGRDFLYVMSRVSIK